MAVKRTGQMSLVEAMIGGNVGGSSGALDRIAGAANESADHQVRDCVNRS